MPMETTFSMYFEEIKALLRNHPISIGFEIKRERNAIDEGFFQIDCNLVSNFKLHIFEYFKDGSIIDDRYQLLNVASENIVRWDNAPHHRDLENFPHHQHIKDSTISSDHQSLHEIMNSLIDYIK